MTNFCFRRPAPQTDAQLGDEIEVEVTRQLRRIASQNAKQALMQHIRARRKGTDLLRVQRSHRRYRERHRAAFDRSDVTVDLGKIRGLAPQSRGACRRRNTRSANASAATFKAVEQAPPGRRSFSRAPTPSLW